MKNLLYIISLCGLLTACDLQEEPYGFYSDDNFYKSETDAESGLLYAYNPHRDDVAQERRGG